MIVKLQYLKGSKEVAQHLNPVLDTRLWNVVSPVLPGYEHSPNQQPTFGVQGLKEQGIIK